jgi:hypothetical protein
MSMERLRLDYQRRDAPLSRPGLALLLLALGTLIAGGGYYFNLTQRLAAWEVNADQMEKAAHRRGLLLQRNSRSDGGESEEIRRANLVLRQLTLPWDRLFESVEAVARKDVALLALAPDAERHLVKIGIEAKNPQAGLDYVRSLEEQAIFQEVLVQSHQIQIQDPDKPIRFSLQAVWKDRP